MVDGNVWEGTTRELIEHKMGKEYKRSSRLVNETLFEKNQKSYHKMIHGAERSSREAMHAQTMADKASMASKLANKLNPTG